MNIYRSVYEHEPLPGKKCLGSLIRVHFGAWRIGYADLHPWPEHGDAGLEEQFNYFIGGSPSMLFIKALYFAAEDAAARRNRRNLLAGLDLPASHFLLSSDKISPGAAVAMGYKRIKVKHSDLNQLEALPKSVRFRIDMNAKITYPEFHLWWEDLNDDVRERIEAIEDPWRGPGGEFDDPTLLFGDWAIDPNWKSRVLKPARDLCDTGELWPRVIFTNSLDHPIGQASALWEAGRFYKKHPRLKEAGGFPQGEAAFADFYDSWKTEGPRRKPTPGCGFGFDEQLNSLSWEKVI